MNKRMLILVSVLLLGTPCGAMQVELRVYFGYVTQVRCHGRLLLSAIGNEKLVQGQAIPPELGCGLILTPKADGGRTDLLIKTTTGDSHFILALQRASQSLTVRDLEVTTEGGTTQ